jgi:hypothetical protein
LGAQGPSRWTSIGGLQGFQISAQSGLKKRKLAMKKILIPLLPVILLSSALTMDAAAQSGNMSRSSGGFVGLDGINAQLPDVAITAVIKDVVVNHSLGIPGGLHVMLRAPQGVLDASVGPYLSAEIQRALIAGTQIKVVGQIKIIGGQRVLFVRSLVLNGNQIAIRNDNGALVRQRSQERIRTQSSLSDQNGGIQ